MFFQVEPSSIVSFLESAIESLRQSDEQDINGIITRDDLIKSLEQRKLHLERIIEARERGDTPPKIDKKVANGSLKNAYNDGNLSDDLRNDVRHKTPDEIAKTPTGGSSSKERKERDSLVSRVEETAVASSPLDNSMISEASEANTTTTTTTTTSDEITTISKLDSKVIMTFYIYKPNMNSNTNSNTNTITETNYSFLFFSQRKLNTMAGLKR